MGCDGGTIPKRDELVRTKKKPEKVDKYMELAAKWFHCSISQEPLKQPIVSCELGRLYNKESVIEYLLDKSSYSNARHIRGLKDIKELNLTENPEYKEGLADKGDSYVDRQNTKFACPVTGLEMNGRYKFCFLWGCGCVFAEKALKEVKSEVCNKCGAPYKSGEEIVINGTKEEEDQLYQKMEEKRELARSLKKSKKALKHKLDMEASTSAGSSLSKQAKADGQKDKDQPSLANNGGDSKFPTKSATNKDKMTVPPSSAASGSSNQEKEFDPTKSKIYKSLFLSKEDKDKPKPHWVTYNPYFAV